MNVMETEVKYLIKDVNLVQLTEWLNTFFSRKKSGEEFSVSDTQGYIRRGHLPAYLGGHSIKIDLTRVKGVRCYSVIDSESQIKK